MLALLGALIMALAPVAQTNRVGTYIVAAGSSSNPTYGNVSLNLIDSDEDWSDVIDKQVVTEPIADGVRAFHIRCPRGVWPGTDGVNHFNHCNENGFVVRVPGAWYALNQAAGQAGGVRLTQGFGTFLASLNAQGCATTVYNNGLPNYKHPDGTGLTNWASDPLTQGNGYPTITDATSLAYIQALYQDELTNGCTECAFDGVGLDRSTYMLSNVLYPLLTGTGTQTASGFSGTFTNPYARKVCVEANPPRGTGAWLTPYTFCLRRGAWNERITTEDENHDDDFFQPAEMANTIGIFVQEYDEAAWAWALEKAATYRVWVKWTQMKAVVGSDRMQELLAAGAGEAVEPPEEEAEPTGAQRPTRNWRARG